MFGFIPGARRPAGASARRMDSANSAAMANGASGSTDRAGRGARNERQREPEHERRLLKRQKAALKSVAEQADEGDREERQIVVEQERAREQAGADDRGRFCRRPKRAPLEPPERGDDRERGCDLRPPGKRERSVHEPNRGEHALHFLVADEIVLQRRAGKPAAGEKALPRRRAERGERSRRKRRRGRRARDQRRPPPGKDERERNRQRQMRFERHRAEKNARERWARVHREKAAADQRGAQEAVLPVRGVDEHSRKREERHRVERRQIGAKDAIDTHSRSP